MKKLLVVGNDKVGRSLIVQLTSHPDLTVVIDVSSNPSRILKLIGRGSLSLRVIARMALAEFLRKDHPVPLSQTITSNQDLLKLIRTIKPKQVYLFRAGLIINQQVIDAGADILNIHCAKIPEYGGLGSIARALAAGAFDQHATLHRVTARIDEGEVLALERYWLDPRQSYMKNEDAAYQAGIRLILRELGEAIPANAPD